MDIPSYVYTMDAKEFSQNAPTVVEDQPATDAVAAMGRGGLNVVFVTKKDSPELLGIITPCDLAKISTARTAKDLATIKDVVALRYDAKLWQLLRLLNGENSLKRQFNRIPLVDESQRLVGVVTREKLNQRMRELDAGAK